MSSRLATVLVAALVVAPAGLAQSDQDPGGQSGPPAPTEPFWESDEDAPAESAVVPLAVPVEPELSAGRGGAVTAFAFESTPVDDLATGRDENEPERFVVRAQVPVEDLATGRESTTRETLDDEEQAAEASASKTEGSALGVALAPVRPNPTSGRAALLFSVDAPMQATVTVFDLTGRRVVVAYDDLAQPDRQHRVELDLEQLASGTYVAVLETSRERLSQTFQVVR